VSRQQPRPQRRHVKNCPQRGCACPWTARGRIDGRQQWITRDTLAEWERAYHEMKAAEPGSLPDKTTTVAQWVIRWEAKGNPGKRLATVRNQRSVLKNHILPQLGHRVLTDLYRDDVELWAARMKEGGTGAAMCTLAANMLRAIYNDWIGSGRPLPRGNPVPVDLCRPGRRREFTPLTATEVNAWVAALPPDLRPVAGAQAVYGSRESEVLALREEDIEFLGKVPGEPLGPQLGRLAALSPEAYAFRRPTLRFQRKLDRITRAERSTEGWARHLPPERFQAEIKNEKGNRTLPLLPDLAAELAAHLSAWPAVDGWLFTNYRAPGQQGRGRAVHPRPWHYCSLNRYLHQAAGLAGVMLPENKCSHALRHHCVSVLRDKGWADQAIAYWIGDTPRTVQASYGQPMPDAFDRIAADLGNVYWGADGQRLGPGRLEAVE
jgi:integrase